ncbi:hypothetical protein OZX65_05860 [Leuconostocaceae bacterium ESL0723]|nr:hypothetical protein OZX65_05860 [Leuconostocaceae bacterium ESL0723]
MQTSQKHSILALILGSSLLFGVLVNLKVPNGTLMTLGGLVGLLLVFLLRKTLAGISPKMAKRLVYLLFALMIVGQILVLHYMPVTIFRDPYRILSQAGQMVAGDFSWHTTYFWRYPNNIPITYLLYGWFSLTNLFHLDNNVAISLLSLLMLDGFIALMLRTIWQISKRTTLLLGAAAFFMLTPFAYTYYLQVFYSDLPSMLFLLLIFRAVYFWQEGSRAVKINRALGLVIVSLLAFLIKSNVVVLAPAFLLVIVIVAIRQRRLVSYLAVPFVLICLGFGLSLPVTGAIYQASHYQKQDRYEFPPSHWIVMGYNEKEAGKYSDSDVDKDANLPSVAERQRYDIQAVRHRFSTYGWKRLIKLWSVKLAVLLDVRDIQSWYNAGFRQAPAWYQQHGHFYDRLQSMLYYLANMALFILLGLRLLSWKINLSSRRDQVALLLITTVLGYLSFHVLLWEVENRYGQLILPILWLILAFLPSRQNGWQIRQRWLKPVLFAGVTAVGAIGLVTLTDAVEKGEPEDFVVAAQRSQLSSMYNSKPDKIKAGSTISQGIYFHRPVNLFYTQIYFNSPLETVLQNDDTKQVYQLRPTKNDDIFWTRTKLPVGHYHLIVHNQTDRTHDIEIVKTTRYKVAGQPLEIDGQAQPDQSFIYTALDRVKKPQPKR